MLAPVWIFEAAASPTHAAHKHTKQKAGGGHSQQPMEGGGGGAGLWLGPHRYYTPKRRSQIYISAGEKKKAQEPPPPNLYCLSAPLSFFLPKQNSIYEARREIYVMFPSPHHFQSQWVGKGEGGLEREPEIPFFSLPPFSHAGKEWVGGGAD